MSEIPSSPNVPVDQPVIQEAQDNKSRIVILILIVFIIIISAGTVYLFLFNKDTSYTVNNSGNNIRENSSARIEGDSHEVSLQKLTVLNNNIANFKENINALNFPALLIEEYRNNSQFLQEYEFDIDSSNFTNLADEEISLSVKQALIVEIDEVSSAAQVYGDADFEESRDLTASIAHTLNIMSYLAQISQSDLINQDGREGWDDAIRQGKVIVDDLISLMGPEYQLPGRQNWIDEAYNREEFRNVEFE